jgi:hypothetical protein
MDSDVFVSQKRQLENGMDASQRKREAFASAMG